MSETEFDIPPTDRSGAPPSAADAGQTARRAGFNARRAAIAALFLILALAGLLRFSGLNWDDGTHLHPDERFLTMVAGSLRPNENPLDYLRTSVSTLNPYNAGQNFYVYGNWPMTVTVHVANWAAAACDWAGQRLGEPACSRIYTGYDGVHLVGRFLSALLDLLTVAFTFFIGRRLYGNWAGLIAAFLMATSVMAIQQSHFFTADNWATFFTAAAIYAAVRAATLGDDEPRWRLRWYAIFGLMLGLAAASRINMVPLALLINVSAIIWIALRRKEFAAGQRAAAAPDAAAARIGWWEYAVASRDLERAIVAVALAAAVFLLTFRVAQPYAFMDAAMARAEGLARDGVAPGALLVTVKSVIGLNPQFLANMKEIQRLQSPDALFPPALQWIDRPAILFPLSNMVLYGMGLTAGIFAVVATLWALWRMFRPGPAAGTSGRLAFEQEPERVPEWMLHAIPVFWTLLYFLYMGTRWVKSVRYFLPIYPTLFVLAGWGLVFLWQRARAADEVATGRRRAARWRRPAAGALLAAVMLPSLLWAITFTRIYRQPLTRVAASDWIYDNIPSGATILYVNSDGAERALNLPLKWVVLIDQGQPVRLDFALPEGGVIHGLRLNYLDDPEVEMGGPGDDGEVIRLTIGDNQPIELPLALDGRRQAVTIDLANLAVAAEQPLRLTLEAAAGGPIRLGTSLLVNEVWDDSLPVGVAGRNPYGDYYSEVTGGQRPVVNPDSPVKREEVIQWLDEADYILLSSQRAIWSQPRNALTYPLMIAYYRSLFDGSLGFELAAEFHEDTWLGPLYISDTAGRLGWGARPNIGWPPPNEWAAEEAFSVYDHPPVWIFRKTAAYDPERTRALLEQVDLSQVVVQNPLEATRARNGMMLTDAEQAAQAAGGTFREVFNLDGTVARHSWLAAVTWLAAMILLGWAAFPLAFVALGGLPDRGYALSRTLGLLSVSWLSWLAASTGLLPFTRWTIVLALFVLLALSAALALWRHHQIAAFFKARMGYVVSVELLGAGLFLLMIGIRLGNPDVWDVIWGGEKPMDLSFFTAVMRSTTFPPYDPWLAGGTINYYYYGYVLVGVVAKLFGTLPSVAYNLALPLLFSMTGLGVFSLAWNLVTAAGRDVTIAPLAPPEQPAAGILRTVAGEFRSPAAVAGLIAVALALLLGNLAHIRTIGTAFYRTGASSLDALPGIGPLARTLDGGIKMLGGEPSPMYTGDWFWNASRAIAAAPGEVQPITEFPFFTFLYGDLHAHMIAMPLQMLALGWAIGLALAANGRGRTANGRRIGEGNEGGMAWVVSLLVGGVAIGALRPTNTWDWPTYLLLGALATGYYFMRAEGVTVRTVGRAALAVAGLAAVSTLAFWPFAARYGSAYGSLSLWGGSYTGLVDYLLIFGLFLFLAVGWLVVEYDAWRRWAREGWPPGGFRQMMILAAVLALSLVALALMRGYRAGLIGAPILVVAGLLSARPGLAAGRRVVAALIAAAVGLTLLVEVVVLDGDIGRMNTVFKFYLQAWLMLSIAGGAAAVWTWEAIKRREAAATLPADDAARPKPGLLLSTAWLLALGALLFVAALYPLTATPAKWAIRMNKEAPRTLDGSAFLPWVEYGDTDYAGRGITIRPGDDVAAIEWLQRNVDGSPVIMEAFGGNPYRSIAARVAMYTGLPAVVGWDWHERQQRAAAPSGIVTERINDVNRFYNTTDTAEARNILARYGVEYLFVGTLENAYYRPEGLAKFDLMIAEGTLEELFRDGTTRVLRVLHDE